MYRQYSNDKIEACVGILRRSATYPKALSAIAGEVDSRLDRTALSKAFKRAGLETPSSYVGMLPPSRVAEGVSALKEPWGLDEILYANGVASGAGVAHTQQRVASGNTTRIMVLPDMHFPFEDREVWSAMLNVVREMRPDVVVIIGDWIDCYSISDFPKTPGRVMSLKDEVDAGGEALDALIGLRVPRIVWTEGNHEERLTRTILAKNPALWGYVPTIPDYLNLKEKGVEWVPYKRWIKIGKFAFSHEVGYCGVNTARSSLQAFGNNIVIGHSHRAATVYSGNTEGEKHVALNVGWGGDFNQLDYGHRSQQMREWQHAFGWIVQDEVGHGWGTVIPFIAGRFIVDGRVISGRKEAA